MPTVKGAGGPADPNGVEGTSLAASGSGVLGTSTIGSGVLGTSTSGSGVRGISTSGDGVQGSSTSARGVEGTSTSGDGVQGSSTSARGVGGSSISGTGVQGDSTSGAGVEGDSTSGYGVVGVSQSGKGVGGISQSGYGVEGISNKADGAGVFGECTGTVGETDSTGGIGVHGVAPAPDTSGDFVGVKGDGRTGVHGIGKTVGVKGEGKGGVEGISTGNAPGVKGTSEQNDGVYGECFTKVGSGVSGVNRSPLGGFGISGTSRALAGSGGAAVLGVNNDGGYAGLFYGQVRKNAPAALAVEGDVHVNGDVYKHSSNFRIDHPLDPPNKYLQHTAVESPDMMNVYNGNVSTDAEGNATVELPSYFEALNGDFRYQLTPIGEFAQAIVAEEVKDNRFGIKTDKANVRVSWQITGIRRDARANAHRIEVEVEKPEGERGRYLAPIEHGQPATAGIYHMEFPVSDETEAD
jgi:hypothetical protein